MNIDVIPIELRRVSQWVAWRVETRHGMNTKVPINPRSLFHAKSDDRSTWGTFAEALRASKRRGMSGVGFVFSATDPYCGIDLDGCISEHGELSSEAEMLVGRFGSYTEVSPSGRGLKIFLRGAKPDYAGCQKRGVFGCKQIEIYDKLRFFTVTGNQIGGASVFIRDRNKTLAKLCEKLWPRMILRPFKMPANINDAKREDRCMKYVARYCERAISGQQGHIKTLRVACEAFRFGLNAEAAMRVLVMFNETKCEPPWTEKELRHKIASAQKKVMAAGEVGRRLARAG